MSEREPATLSGALLARKGTATANGFAREPEIKHVADGTGRRAIPSGPLWILSLAVAMLAATVLLDILGAGDDSDIVTREPGQPNFASSPQPVAGPTRPAVLQVSAPSSPSIPVPTAAKETTDHSAFRAMAPPDIPAPYRIQLFALRSMAAADRQWRKLQHAHDDLFGGLTMTTARVSDLPDGLVRVRAGPLPNLRAARTLCDRARKRRLDCLVVGPSS